MEKLKTVLKIWMKLSTHARMRDRSMKVLQYGCQMLMGFYASRISESTREMLALSRKTASTCRKGFWLFKSINHVESLVKFLDAGLTSNGQLGLAEYALNIIEQIYLIIYHYYETIVYLARTKMIAPENEEAVEVGLNNSWFISDLVGLLLQLIYLAKHLHKIYLKYLDLAKECNAIEYPANSNKSRVGEIGGVPPVGKQTTKVTPYKVILADRELMTLLFDKTLSCTIASLETLVSADFINIWKRVVGANLGDGIVGLSGTCSSLMILLQAVIKGYREL